MYANRAYPEHEITVPSIYELDSNEMARPVYYKTALKRSAYFIRDYRDRGVARLTSRRLSCDNFPIGGKCVLRVNGWSVFPIIFKACLQIPDPDMNRR